MVEPAGNAGNGFPAKIAIMTIEVFNKARKPSAKCVLSIYKGGYLRLNIHLVKAMGLAPGDSIELVRISSVEDVRPMLGDIDAEAVWGLVRSTSDNGILLRQAVSHSPALIFNAATMAERILDDYKVVRVGEGSYRQSVGMVVSEKPFTMTEQVRVYLLKGKLY